MLPSLDTLSAMASAAAAEAAAAVQERDRVPDPVLGWYVRRWRGDESLDAWCLGQVNGRDEVLHYPYRERRQAQRRWRQNPRRGLGRERLPAAGLNLGQAELRGHDLDAAYVSIMMRPLKQGKPCRGKHTAVILRGGGTLLDPVRELRNLFTCDPMSPIFAASTPLLFTIVQQRRLERALPLRSSCMREFLDSSSLGGVVVILVGLCTLAFGSRAALRALLHSTSVGSTAKVAPQATNEEATTLLDQHATDVPPSSPLVITVNGRKHVVSKPSPSMLLSEFLREILSLTGTKVGCGEGGCGACTVIAVSPDKPHAPISINACLRLLCACDGFSITTVEGLGSSQAGFSVVQKAIAEGLGTQCGFCTPGWVTAMTALLAAHAGPDAAPLTAKVIEEALDGNLCRCTGYRPILQAFKERFAEAEAKEEIEDLGRQPCHDTRTGQACARECESACEHLSTNPPRPFVERAAQQVKCKAELATLVCCQHDDATAVIKHRAPRTICYSSNADGLAYYRPAGLAELHKLLREIGPSAHVICANTGMGVMKYYSAYGACGAEGQPPQQDAQMVDVSGVAELRSAPTVTSDGVMEVRSLNLKRVQLS